MKNFVKYLGFALVIIGAILAILGFAMEWNDINLVNFGSIGLIIVGLTTYICAGKYIR